MKFKTLLTFVLFILCARSQETRKSKNLVINFGDNSIDKQNKSGEESGSLEDVSRVSNKEKKYPQGTKYPILIPKVFVDEIEGEGLSVDGIEEQDEFSEDYQGDQGIESDDDPKISPSNLAIRSCGVLKENCYREGMNGFGRPEKIDFMREPFYCRCDQGVCDEYGDCCVTAAHNLRQNNPWRCHPLQHEVRLCII